MKLSDIDPNDIEVIEEAPKASGLRLSDLDDNDIEVVEESQGPGVLESLGRGSLEGGTFGFSGELAGLNKALTGEDVDLTTFVPGAAMAKATKNVGGKLYDVATTDKTLSDLLKELKSDYVSKRDEVDAANKLAAETNPIAYNVGDIGTSVGTGLMTGGAGLVGKGLSAAGLKLAAKEGGKELLEQGVKRGGLSALTTVGLGEGLLHGAGRSEADLTEGEVGEFAQDTLTGGLIGAAAPSVLQGTGWLGKKGLSLADDALSNAPIVDDLYTHLKGVYKEGGKRLDDSFKSAARKAVSTSTQRAKDISQKGAQQIQQYSDDLLKGQTQAADLLDSTGSKYREELKKSLDFHGENMSKKDVVIDELLRKNPKNLLREVPGGMKLGSFNFDPLDEVFEKAASSLDAPIPMLANIQKDLKSADYPTVVKKLKDINRLMSGNVTPNNFHQLQIIKDSIEETLQKELKSMSPEAFEVYMARMGDAKQYSQLAQARQKLSAQSWRDDGQLADAVKFIANPTETGGKPLLRSMQEADSVGLPSLRDTSQDLISSGKQVNKFNINPEKGKMFDDLIPENASDPRKIGPLTAQGQNERSGLQFTKVLGKPDEFDIKSKAAETINLLSEDNLGSVEMNRRKEFLDWMSKTYPTEYDKLLKEMSEESRMLNLFESGLEKNTFAGQDLTSKMRIVKKAADPLSYGMGRTAGRVNRSMQNISQMPVINKIAPGMNQASALRALTQPQLYKDVVKGFKESQQQGDADPNAVE